MSCFPVSYSLQEYRYNYILFHRVCKAYLAVAPGFNIPTMLIYLIFLPRCGWCDHPASGIMITLVFICHFYPSFILITVS